MTFMYSVDEKAFIKKTSKLTCDLDLTHHDWNLQIIVGPYMTVLISNLTMAAMAAMAAPRYLSMDSKDSKGVWIDSPHFECPDGVSQSWFP